MNRDRAKRLINATIDGVDVVRRTGVYEPSLYDATVVQSGRCYQIAGGNSKRLPWLITYNGARVCARATLPDAVRAIVADDAARCCGPTITA